MQGEIRVGDPCHLEMCFHSTLEHLDLFIDESIPLRFMQISKFGRKLAKRGAVCTCTSVLAGTVEVWYSGGRGSGRGRTHLRREMRCLPDRCRAPQDGETPLQKAARNGHAVVAEKLLAAKADVKARSNVRGQAG